MAHARGDQGSSGPKVYHEPLQCYQRQQSLFTLTVMQHTSAHSGFKMECISMVKQDLHISVHCF
jgi:hypothetical protein